MSVNPNQTYYNDRNLDHVKNFIENKYDIVVTNIEIAKRGYMAETYIVSTEKSKFFAKTVYLNSHKDVYQNSFKVVDFLNRNNIDFILKNIRTKNNELTCEFEKGIFGLFNFIEGEHSDNYPLSLLFKKYSLIYQVNANDLDIKKEDFKSDIIELFELNLSKIKNNELLYKEVINFFDSNKDLIEEYMKKLSKIGNQCSKDLNDFHITHGDGQGNIIVNGNNITIIDWDTPLLSPIERDAWVFLDNQVVLNEFSEVLNENSINYKFKKERLRYYCLFYFFYYLALEMEIIISLNDETKIKKIFEDIKDLFSPSNWLCKKLSVISTDI